MRKIMFNDKYGLTKAVLEGRKTMTRRIANPISENIDKLIFGKLRDGKNPYNGGVVYCLDGRIYKPAFKVGEVIAVAQSYHALNKEGFGAPEWLDHTCEDSAGYENKMFVRADLMPYQIRITNVRVERLQDISDEECIREGIVKVQWLYGCEGLCERGDQIYFIKPRGAFAALIDKISGKGTWDSNPYMFVYEFELVR